VEDYLPFCFAGNLQIYTHRGGRSMVTFILLSGLFTPTENVPAAFQFLVKINPLAYLIKIIREIFLKGNGIEYFYKDLLALIAIAVTIITISLLNFKRFVSK
jgi:ABC-2 type transport system permease protein